MGYTAETITPGFYAVTANVQNPGQTDYRKSHWARRDVVQGALFGVRKDWESGFLLICPANLNGTSAGEEVLVAPVREPYYKPLVDALLPVLARRPDSLGSVLFEHHVSASNALRLLVTAGKLTLDDVREVLPSVTRG